MAITNYDSLKTAISNWCPRGDLSSQVAEFIQMAESMLNRPPSSGRQLGGVRVNKTRTSGTLTAGTDTLALPSDFLEYDRFLLTADNIELVSVPSSSLKKRTGSGQPKYVSVQDVFEFDVAPDAAYAYQLSYWPSVSALSNSNTTNWLLTNYPDVYLAACMYWTWTWARDAAEVAAWAGRYAEGAAMVNKAYKRRLSQGPIAIQMPGAAP